MVIGANQETATVRARSFVIWGEDLSKKGRYAAAEKLYQRAQGLVQETLGSYHPMMAEVLESYSGLLLKTDRRAEAAAMKSRSEAIWEAYAPRPLSTSHSDPPCRTYRAEQEGSD
jgi:Tetratricopeptide repeat